MQIIVSEGEVPDGDDRVLDEARILLVDAGLDGEVRREVISRGIDWPVLLLSIGGVFLLGDKIEKNLVAWAALAKRFQLLLNTLTNRFRTLRVDEEGALLIALNDLYVAEPDCGHIQQLPGNSIPFRHAFDRPGSGLECAPDQLYVCAFAVDRRSIWVYGIKSSGSIEFRHRFDADWHKF